jgi:hypothetical protein
MPGEVIEALSVFAAVYTLTSLVFAAVVAVIFNAVSAKGRIGQWKAIRTRYSGPTDTRGTNSAQARPEPSRTLNETVSVSD